jgi:hypothetical protein
MAALTTRPPRLSESQATLLLETVELEAPKLVPVARRVAAGEVVADADANELEDALVRAMTSDYTTEGGLTQRGMALDAVVGIARQHAVSFFRGDAS